MPFEFGTFGPFELPRKAGRVSREDLKQLWENASREYASLKLQEGIGVYVLATKKGNSDFLPWYVGLTRGRFRSRFYQHGHNKPGSPFVRLAKHKKTGNIYVFLLPRMTSPTRLMRSKIAGEKRKTKVMSITELEFILIGRCFSANKNLLNISEKSFQAGFRVPGVTDNPKKLSKAASTFAAMIYSSK